MGTSTSRAEALQDVVAEAKAYTTRFAPGKGATA
jgi:hypothetical protein